MRLAHTSDRGNAISHAMSLVPKCKRTRLLPPQSYMSLTVEACQSRVGSESPNALLGVVRRLDEGIEATEE